MGKGYSAPYLYPWLVNNEYPWYIIKLGHIQWAMPWLCDYVLQWNEQAGLSHLNVTNIPCISSFSSTCSIHFGLCFHIYVTWIKLVDM